MLGGQGSHAFLVACGWRNAGSYGRGEPREHARKYDGRQHAAAADGHGRHEPRDDGRTNARRSNGRHVDRQASLSLNEIPFNKLVLSAETNTIESVTCMHIVLLQY